MSSSEEKKNKHRFYEIPSPATEIIQRAIKSQANENGKERPACLDRKQKTTNETRISDERFLLVHSSAGGHIRIVIDVAVVVVVVDDVHVLMIGSSNKRIHAMHGITKEMKKKTTTQRDIFFIFSPISFRRLARSFGVLVTSTAAASTVSQCNNRINTRKMILFILTQTERERETIVCKQHKRNYFFPNVNRFLLLLDARIDFISPIPCYTELI